MFDAIELNRKPDNMPTSPAARSTRSSLRSADHLCVYGESVTNATVAIPFDFVTGTCRDDRLVLQPKQVRYCRQVEPEGHEGVRRCWHAAQHCLYGCAGPVSAFILDVAETDFTVTTGTRASSSDPDVEELPTVPEAAETEAEPMSVESKDAPSSSGGDAAEKSAAKTEEQSAE
eukprot:2898079-Rhodomonas_salina.1